MGAVQGLKDAYNEGKVYVQKIENFGTMMVQGLRDKIAGGAAQVAEAVRNLLKGAVDAGKETLDAHSPSKVAGDELGAPIPQGTAHAITKGKDEVAEAVDDMLQLKGPTAASAGGGGGATLNNTGNHFIFNGVKDAEHASELFDEKLMRSLERMADQGGAEAQV
jgi:hypothetical protein